MAKVRPALPAPRTVLGMLALQPLDQHKDMKILTRELHKYYQKISKETFVIELVKKPPQELEIDMIVIEFFNWFLSVLKELLREQSPKPIENLFDAIRLVGSIIQHNWSMLNVIIEVFKDAKKRVAETLRKLRATLVHFSVDLENLFLHYTVMDREIPCPSSDDITRHIHSVLENVKYLKTLKLVEYADKIPTEIQVSPEDYLYCLLGLSSPSVKNLTAIPEDVKIHQTHTYWIQKLINDNSYDQDDILNPEQVFINIGVTEGTAKGLTQFLKENPFRSHQTPAYWVQRYTEHLYDILLNNVPRYPYSEETGTFKERVIYVEHEKDGDDTESGENKQIIRYINVPDHARKGLTRDGSPYPPSSNDEYYILCHGTDHQSAVDIVENGIDLAKGNEKQDFSNGHGFYLNPRFDQAVQWAKCGRFKQYSVVVYKIPKQVIESKKVLDLSGEGEVKWTQVIKDNRMGISRKKLKQKYNMDFIRGPMCTNQQEIGKYPPKGYDTESGTIQYCILSDAMAEELDKFVDAVIFH